MRFQFAALLLASGSCVAHAADVTSLVGRLQSAVPTRLEATSDSDVAAIRSAGAALETWARQKSDQLLGQAPAALLDGLGQILAAADGIESALRQGAELRARLANLPADERRRGTIRALLRINAELKRLTGRMRYLLRDAIDDAAYDFDSAPQWYERFVDLLIRHRVSVAPEVLEYTLFDPDTESGTRPFPDHIRRKTLQLTAETRATTMLNSLAEFVRSEDQPALVVYAVSVIKTIGLPQASVPGLTDTFQTPPITAAELSDRLRSLDIDRLDRTHRSEYHRLLVWLAERDSIGADDRTFRYASCDIESGDWLLTDAPSPYDYLTDMSPPLYGQAAVVTTFRDTDGKRRFVAVHLPRTGNFVAVSNVDAYLEEAGEFVVLRHPDAAVRRTMGRVAATITDKPLQYEPFDTLQVTALRGDSDGARRIETNDAGLLLLCAQETEIDVARCFPYEEHLASPIARANLKVSDATDRFLSPTAAWTGSELRSVGARWPVYDTNRDIRSGVYERFAMLTSSRSLRPEFHSANVADAVRQVVENQVRQFAEAIVAIKDGSPASIGEPDGSATTVAQWRRYRETHTELTAKWESRDRQNPKFTPRDLRNALIDHYKRNGQQELDDWFVPPAGKTE